MLCTEHVCIIILLCTPVLYIAGTLYNTLNLHGCGLVEGIVFGCADLITFPYIDGIVFGQG